MRKSRTGEKVEDRRESRGQARKLRTGDKVEDRRQSQEQAAKSRTGSKADNRHQSQEQALKATTGGVVIAEHAVHRLWWCPAFGQAGTYLFLSVTLNSD